LFSNFRLECAIRGVQAKQEDLKLNSFADDVSNIYIWQKFTSYKENTEALLVASKENGLEVNADKTKCMVML
jgi:hypothetical protein